MPAKKVLAGLIAITLAYGIIQLTWSNVPEEKHKLSMQNWFVNSQMAQVEVVASHIEDIKDPLHRDGSFPSKCIAQADGRKIKHNRFLELATIKRFTESSVVLSYLCRETLHVFSFNGQQAVQCSQTKSDNETKRICVILLPRWDTISDQVSKSVGNCGQRCLIISRYQDAAFSTDIIYPDVPMTLHQHNKFQYKPVKEPRQIILRSVDGRVLTSENFPKSHSLQMSTSSLTPLGACFTQPAIHVTRHAEETCLNLLENLHRSRFCLVEDDKMAPLNTSLQSLVWLCLAARSVPVLLTDGSRNKLASIMPLSELLGDVWSNAVVQYPIEQQGVLLSFLDAVSPAEYARLLNTGSLLFRRYLENSQVRFSSLLAILQLRVGVLPAEPPFYHLKEVPQHTSLGITIYAPNKANAQWDLHRQGGVMENINSSSKWPSNLFWSYQHTPWDQVSQPTFTSGGNAHPENLRPRNSKDARLFTIIILTYDRMKPLYEVLSSLNQLTHLHSVVVVWNNRNISPSSTRWPKLHAPIKVIVSDRNSLNSRFLPFNIIETDAVLSLDEDTSLTTSEIEFAFRIWKQNTDVLVGFADRSFLWNDGKQKWEYSWSTLPTYSMILTSAAFFHRYYLLAYTHELPRNIYDLIDKRMNCEDIALNFIIAQLSGRPNLKVTPKRTFSCPSCTARISSSPDHLSTRSRCVNEMASGFGYIPMLQNAFRIDPVP